MGGEYLPDCLDEEVEIARVCYASTTADVTSIRARRVGPAIICYRVVDEHGCNYELPLERSSQPLSLGQLIELIDKTNSDDGYGQGLVLPVLQGNYDAVPESENLRDFVSVESDFYPAVGAYSPSEP